MDENELRLLRDSVREALTALSTPSEVRVRMASEDGVRLISRLADSAIIEADETDLRRVVGNLLENAKKYGLSETDGIPHVMLETRVSHSRVELSVLDEGPGIPDDQIGLVTRPFYRVNSARTQANGTGLGMAIVQRLVSRHHGTLKLRNRTPGPGLEVTIEFPLAKSA